MSEQVPVYIKEVALVDFKGFKGEHRFSFIDEKGGWCQWNVFLGNNNTGKTNLLKAIASLEPTIIEHDVVWDDLIEPIDEAMENIAKELGVIPQKIKRSQAVYVPSGHGLNYCPEGSELGIDLLPIYHFSQRTKTLLLNGISIVDGDYQPKIAKGISYNSNKSKGLLALEYGSYSDYYQYSKIYGYGVIREIEKKGISSERRNELNADNLFNNTSLINFEDWLFQLDYGANNPHSESKEKFSRNRELLKSVLTGDIFPEIKDLRFISDKQLNNYIEFQTEDGWHRMSELGYGYQSTLSWMADFCKKMFDRYPESSNPLKEPAVLLIDEIDLHLHPQWQRELIKSLSSIFPQTQFIVTTHSPFIIQSMENVNLYTLNRVGDHTEVTRLGNKSYIGWKIEEILSEVMGLEENTHTDRYNQLMSQFDKALDTDDYASGKEAYDQLMLILHPQSAERKLLDIQFTQLTPEHDKA